MLPETYSLSQSSHRRKVNTVKDKGRERIQEDVELDVASETLFDSSVSSFKCK